jgi:IclR family acetate operon transcriptional repressor
MPATAKTPDQKSKRYIVPILERALIILEALAKAPRGMGISELSRELGMPKNSVFRILTTLYSSGYLQRDHEGRIYSLSRKILALGYEALDDLSLVDKSLDVMRDLRDETGETVLLGTLAGDHGVVLELVPSSQPIKFLVDVGARFPLHTAAPAKAMLAFLPERDLEAQVKRIVFRKFTASTITSQAPFRRLLEEVRESGVAFDREEEMESLHCVAAPIFDHRGYPVAALWITGPSYRFREEDFPRLGRKVRQAAERVSARFGHNLLKT